jgi:hypothetical protein
MNQPLYYCLICLVFFFSSCQSNPEKKQEKKGTPIVYKITGSLNPEMNGTVYLQDHDNPIQQFHRGKVEQGKFVLEGELVIDAFYDLIIKSDSGAVKSFHYSTPLYVEADADYDVVIKEKGDHFNIDVKTNSLTTNELIAFNKSKEKVQHELDEQLSKYSDEIAALNAKLMTFSRGQESVYNQTIDRLEEILKKSNKIRDRKDDKRFYEEYVLNSKQKASFLIPYSFKYISLNKENYKDYDHILAHLDPSIQKHPLVRAAVAKVDEVKNYYDNMPVFPAITPRNVKGDSLKFDQLVDKKMIIVAVWSSKGKNSKMDLPVLVRKESELKKMGVEVVYLTDDEDYERWRASNRQIGLGMNSYLLNVTDRDFIENSYNVIGTPRYLWLDPKSRAVIELAGADPTLPDFIKNVKNKL